MWTDVYSNVWGMFCGGKSLKNISREQIYMQIYFEKKIRTSAIEYIEGTTCELCKPCWRIFRG